MSKMPDSIAWMLRFNAEHQGDITYSESGPFRLSYDKAHMLSATDCSGLFAKEHSYVSNGKLYIGTYTGNECNYGHLVSTSKSAVRSGYGLLPGDGILFDWDGYYRNGQPWDHIAMYAGGGKIWNHGGPGNGPLLWSLANSVDNAVRVMARRYITWPADTVSHPPVSSGTKTNPMHGHSIPALIAAGTGDFFGLESDPRNESHGGYYASERPYVLLIEQFLAWYYPVASKTMRLKADGHYGPVTQALVRAFQKQHMPGTQYYGQVWFDDWVKMASL